MGRIWFDPMVLNDFLSETVGFKAGLALSVSAMCDLLEDTDYAELLRASETTVVQIRSESFDDLFYKLLHRVGYTEEEFDGDSTGILLFHKYKNTDLADVYMRVTEMFNEIWPQLIDETVKAGKKAIDPTPFVYACRDELGLVGAKIALEKIESIDRGLKLSPHSNLRYTEWTNVAELEALFAGSKDLPVYGSFIDQRFVNYLHRNRHDLGNMHWRKFEELAAEYFDRKGMQVELGPGRNDDGVDLRVWNDNSKDSSPPTFIVQCKRVKEKIDKVTVKGLYADTEFEGAERGLLVTTSELSPGARKSIRARAYPIEEINRDKLGEWLSELHVPGTGIVRT